ncbi:Calcium-responsive transactivator [Varanus komodoensis]|nr:Calcium-responsive transactivator [Varanus komodoensis]
MKGRQAAAAVPSPLETAPSPSLSAQALPGNPRAGASGYSRTFLAQIPALMLDENHHLIQCIMDYQSKGKTAECTQYQQILHRNLVYLATIADSNQNMQSLLPAPPTQNMTLGPGGMNQSASNQSLHSQSNLSDAIGTGLPPSSLMQSQISNGPSHVSMQQSGQSTMPTTSLSMTVSSHGTGTGYSHTVPASQNVPMQGQGSIGNYVSRTNINMQSNPVSMMHQQAATSHYNSAQAGTQHYQGQSSIAMMSQSNQGNSMMGQRPMGPYRPSQQGSSQQYMGQEEYYSEQYSHGQGSSEPMNQQYYPDVQVTVIMHTSSQVILSKATIDHLRIPPSITMKEGIPSIASSRQDTSKELHNSKHIHSSNTQISKVIQDNSKDMGQPKEPRHSIPVTHRARGSSTEVTELRRQGQGHSNRGLMATNRASMETISNKIKDNHLC